MQRWKMSDIDQIDRALKAHAALRAAIADAQASIEPKVKSLSNQVELIEKYLASVLSDKLPKIATAAGTIELVTKTYYNIADWDAFLRSEFADALRQTDMFECTDDGTKKLNQVVAALLNFGPTFFLKRDVRRTAVQEFVAEHEQPPTGIKAFAKNELKVTHTKRKAYADE